ncbi:hypothetical protein ASC94_23465 [Massilia sp. Root418]|uniref:hypothetical protein n=1 Tax=Massilia sp. Root418 TaxID=1736532 RepID=UPI0006FFBE6F|nr:hypothetical protein [Massilia sp. Root418]KQW88394.1 hypothetical protein ASC94_23465 [Massilia sp. Root418]
MTPRHMLMAAALVAAAGLVIFGDRTPAGSELAEAVDRRAPAARPLAAGPAPAAAPAPTPAPSAGTGGAKQVQVLRLLPRAELIGETGEGSFGGAGSVFGSQNWTPPPPPPQAPPPPPPPQAPPLPFTYIGKAASDGAWEVFLARADKTYVVRAQTVIDGVYRVDAVAPPTLKLTYLPLNQSQQLNIGVPD